MKTEHQDDVLGLIARNLAGIADPKEISKLQLWLGVSPGNRRYFEQIKNIWDASDRQIDPEKINTSSAFEKVLEQLPEFSGKKTFWYYWQKIAAIIIIPLTIGGLLWYYLNTSKSIIYGNSEEIVYNEVFTAVGTRSSLRLSDSTIVWLNSGSSIRYPITFSNETRTVYIKGEAYFEVKSDNSKPFIVQTPSLAVKAVGTKFNVSEYVSNKITEVTLVSGKVTLLEKDNKKDTQIIKVLSPDEHLIYNRVTKVKNSIIGDTYRYISWKDGILMFRDEPLESVVNEISQFFNVDIELRGEELKSYRYYATFKEESLGEILKLLKISAPIDYMEIKREPLPDGSFPKKKVIIWQTK